MIEFVPTMLEVDYLSISANTEKTRLLQTRPNLGAELINKKMGVKFQQKPDEVRLGFWNRFILATDSSFKHALFEASGEAFSSRDIFNLKFSLGGEIGGFYMPFWNTDFVVPQKNHDKEIACSIHENFHAFVNQEYPFTSQMAKQCDMEQLMAYRFCNEGIAMWGMEMVLHRMEWPKWTIKELDQRSQSNANHIGMLNILSRDYQEANTSHLSYLRGEGEELLKAEEIEEINYDCYKIAPQFIGLSMDYLIRTGMSTAEALSLLIHNLPSKVAQLENPKTYAESLLT